MQKNIVRCTLAASLVMVIGIALGATSPKTFKFNNLTWTVPDLHYDSKLKNWKEADKYCKDAGSRLPTKDELMGLNRAGLTPEGWASNVTMTSTPFGTNKHYTIFVGQLDGLGWSSDVEQNLFTCVK